MVLEEENRLVTCVATAPSEVIGIRKPLFQQLVGSNPALMEAGLVYFASPRLHSVPVHKTPRGRLSISHHHVYIVYRYTKPHVAVFLFRITTFT